MKKGLFLLIMFLIGIGLFVFALQSTDLYQVANALISLFPFKFILVFLVFFTSLALLSSFRWYSILKSQNQKISYLKLLLVKIVGQGFSYITPIILIGGEPFRYIILREEESTSPSVIIASIFIEKLVFFLVSMVAFLLGVFFFLFYIKIIWRIKLLVIAFFAVGFLISALIYWRLKKFTERKGFLTWLMEKLYLSKIDAIKKHKAEIKDIENEIGNFFRNKKREKVKIFSIAVVEILLLLVTFWILIAFIAGPLAFEKVVAIHGIMGLAGLVPLPAALGSLEMSQSYIFEVFNLSSDVGITFSLVYRAFNLIIVLFAFILFIIFQIRFFKDKIVKILTKDL